MKKILLLSILSVGIFAVKLRFLEPADNFLGYQRGHIMTTDASGFWRIDSTLSADSIVAIDQLTDTASSIRADFPIFGPSSDLEITYDELRNSIGVASLTAASNAVGDTRSMSYTSTNFANYTYVWSDTTYAVTEGKSSVAKINTGSSSGGVTSLRMTQAGVRTNQIFYFEAEVRFPTTTRWSTYRAGLGLSNAVSVLSASSSNEISILSSSTGTWEYRVAGSLATSYVDTGIPIPQSQWLKVGFSCDTVGTDKISFLIDDVVIGIDSSTVISPSKPLFPYVGTAAPSSGDVGLGIWMNYFYVTHSL